MSDAALRIFLVGYRGTGKNTIARFLAERLGWNWVDADTLLEERARKTIRQIFAEEGEAAFRERESNLLEELCRRERYVIATGGGIVLRDVNRRRLKAEGICVWLIADAATIWQRIESDVTTAERRPALTVGGRAEIEQLLAAREPHYRKCADLIVDTVNRAPEAITGEVVDKLAELSR